MREHLEYVPEISFGLVLNLEEISCQWIPAQHRVLCRAVDLNPGIAIFLLDCFLFQLSLQMHR